jgi:hypothetical protein
VIRHLRSRLLASPASRRLPCWVDIFTSDTKPPTLFLIYALSHHHRERMFVTSENIVLTLRLETIFESRNQGINPPCKAAKGTASQMRCPHHFKNATVEMAGERFDDFNMEVIPRCDEFRRCVEKDLNKLVEQPSLIVAPAVAITTPNPPSKYPRANLPTNTTPASNIRIRGGGGSDGGSAGCERWRP